MRKKRSTLILFMILATLILVLHFQFELNVYLTLFSLKENYTQLQEMHSLNPFIFTTLYFFLYVILTTFCIPSATILTLAAGALFGFTKGVIIVSFASTIGATFAFLFARFIFRDFLEQKFKVQLDTINDGLNEDGAYYLFTLRLVPLFPFFLINLVMGLTRIGTLTFMVVSQIGMLLGAALYVNAGTQLANINSVSEILSLKLMISFLVIGIFPLVAKQLIKQFKRE